ncbi:MAG TPA: DNA alkylation repair protein [Candidatus Limnocylindrales bacterium]|nr:DNA alkylation repair protein [Candidatus Limnocylindrales bacterium]
MTMTTASPITERAVAFVADRKADAEDLGRRLADDIDDPDRFATTLSEGFADLADPEYHDGSHLIIPTLGRSHGVRWPLIQAVSRGFRDATRRERTSTWLFLADRLFREPEIEARWFAFGLLDRLLDDEPERAWQLLRRAAREATDWATVDALAHALGRGILNEPYRWAELEQLVYSPRPWERRLVGSTIATIPFVDRRRGRAPEVAEHGLDLIRDLIGDAAPDVQKALSWALRSLTIVDRPAVARFLAAEARTAAATADGHRAWVIRDALSKVEEPDAHAIRERLGSIRRRAGAPPTSRAADTAARFGQGLLGGPVEEPPLR